MSMIGKKVRLGRLFDPVSGNMIALAMDHGAPLGPVKGLEDPRQTLKESAAGDPDLVFMPRGVVKATYPILVKERIPFLLALDTANLRGPDPDRFVLADTVDGALSLGASGVSMHVLIGPEYTTEMTKYLASTAIRCDELGMPLMAIMYPEGDDPFDVERVKHAARIGAELGADVVKTYYTGDKESFAEVVRCCPVPVLMSGGPREKTEEEFLMKLKAVMDAGGRGAAVGRNVWQHDKPAAMLRAVRKIVHEGSSVEEALAELT
jgi:fructose-bisphosphate aldolase / 2-amino-3,7-dideoxy-D-threo-hept-6-ulosonate synthase